MPTGADPLRGGTPVFLPGKSLGQRRLVGYSRWGRRESDTNELLSVQLVGVPLSSWPPLLWPWLREWFPERRALSPVSCDPTSSSRGGPCYCTTNHCCVANHPQQPDTIFTHYLMVSVGQEYAHGLALTAVQVSSGAAIISRLNWAEMERRGAGE